MRKQSIWFLFCIIYVLIALTGCQLFFEKPGTPELLYVVQSAQIGDENSITIKWKNSENADKYTIFWSENPIPVEVIGASKTITALEGGTRTAVFTHTDFTTDTSLYFWVYAENPRGTSDRSSSKKASISVEKEWTIMVWLDGDNSLESAAKEDFHEMEAGLYAAMQSDLNIMDNVNIIVQYDSKSDGDFGRFLVQPEDSEPESSSPSLGKLYGGLDSEPNMGSAVDLQDFIQFSKQIYPADKYALILWNHGGGVRSLQADSSSREICEDVTDGDVLYIGEIKDVLTKDESVNFLGMDACLMGMTEIAYEFRPPVVPGTGDFSAQAMAFSPAEEQVDGWEYQNIINRFGSTNLDTMEGADLARIVVEEYENAFSSYEFETQTAVDLTKIANVKTELDQLAVLIVDYKDEIELIRGSAVDLIADSEKETNLMHYFDTSSGYEWENYAGFDLYELADSIVVSEMAIDITNAAIALKTAVNDAIITSWAGDSYAGFTPGENGLSIFFPDGDAVYPSGSTTTYWDYQYFYSSRPHAAIDAWASSFDLNPNYGALDFCDGDADSLVESWFELLQSWYNPDASTLIHPGPMW
jgi:clostripain